MSHNSSVNFSSDGVSDSFILVNPVNASNWFININNLGAMPGQTAPLTESGGTTAAAEFLTLQLTRGTGLSQNQITIDVTGDAFGSTTHTMTGLLGTESLYFALEKFTGGGASTGQLDNLSHSHSAPVPAALVMGRAGLGLVAARRRRLRNASANAAAA